MAHVAGYLESTHSELAAVCDLLPERRAALGGTFASGSMKVLEPLFRGKALDASWESMGIRCYTSLDELLADPSVDMISLCTPDYLHADHGIRVLEAGKHLLLEKPVDISMEKAAELGRAVDANGRYFAVAYEFRLHPAVLAMKRLADSGDLGEIAGFSLYHFRTPFRRDKWNKWIQSRSMSGGLIVEETCHWFDLARYITGLELESLSAVSNDRVHPDFDYEDIAFINGTYRNGAVMQISHSLTGHDFSLIIQLHGTRASAWCGMKEEESSSLDAFRTSHYALLSVGKPGGAPRDAELTTWGEEASEAFAIRKFTMEAARLAGTGGPSLCSFDEGREALRLSLQAVRSAAEGGERIIL
jgi:predicted dehydrogenase